LETRRAEQVSKVFLLRARLASVRMHTDPVSWEDAGNLGEITRPVALWTSEWSSSSARLLA
jgi:hypothetical protein